MSRTTRRITLGGVALGGGAPVAVQSMCSTDTRDVAATAEQIRRLAAAGCEIVRCAVPDEAAALALADLRRQCPLPLVADIHFDYRLALTALQSGVDGLRLNPGNIGERWKVEEVVRASRRRAGFPSASGSTPVPWKRTCWPVTATRPPRPWWKAPCATSGCWRN